MFGSPLGNGLSIVKVVRGLSKTLSIANQVIPLYKEAKPIINNARTVMGVLKGLNTQDNKTVVNKQKDSVNETKANISTKKSTKVNSPRFFL